MLRFAQLPASYKNPFRVAKDHTCEEPGDAVAVSSCRLLHFRKKDTNGATARNEYTF